jgi:hypothetical protein
MRLGRRTISMQVELHFYRLINYAIDMVDACFVGVTPSELVGVTVQAFAYVCCSVV